MRVRGRRRRGRGGSSATPGTSTATRTSSSCSRASRAYAAAIAALLEDAAARARLGAAARRAVEDVRAWEAVLDRIEGVYRLVLARQAAPTRIPILSEVS